MGSDRPTYEEIQIEYADDDGGRCVATVYLTVWPGDPGHLFGRPEDCWPAEGGEWGIDCIEVWSDATERVEVLEAGSDAADAWEEQHEDEVAEVVARRGWV